MISESVDCVTVNCFVCETIYASAPNNSFLLKITACFTGISINTSDFIMLLVNNQCGFCTIDHGDTYVSCTIGLNLPRNVLDECVECPFSESNIWFWHPFLGQPHAQHENGMYWICLGRSCSRNPYFRMPRPSQNSFKLILGVTWNEEQYFLLSLGVC